MITKKICFQKRHFGVNNCLDVILAKGDLYEKIYCFKFDFSYDSMCRNE